MLHSLRIVCNVEGQTERVSAVQNTDKQAGNVPRLRPAQG